MTASQIVRVGSQDYNFSEFNTDGQDGITLAEFKAKLSSMGLSEAMIETLFNTYKADNATLELAEFNSLCSALEALNSASGGIAGKVDIQDVRLWIFNKLTESTTPLSLADFLTKMRGMGASDAELTVLFGLYSGGDGSISGSEIGQLLSAVKSVSMGGSISVSLQALAVLSRCAYAESPYFSGALSAVAGLDAQVQELLNRMKTGAGANLSETVAISTELGVINSRLSSVLSIIADMKQMLKDAANPR